MLPFFTHINAPGLPPKQKPSQIFFHRGKYMEIMVASKRTSLVCGLEHFLFSIIYIYIYIHINIWDVIIPMDFHISQRGRALPPTSSLNGLAQRAFPPTKGDDHQWPSSSLLPHCLLAISPAKLNHHEIADQPRTYGFVDGFFYAAEKLHRHQLLMHWCFEHKDLPPNGTNWDAGKGWLKVE